MDPQVIIKLTYDKLNWVDFGQNEFKHYKWLNIYLYREAATRFA